MNKTNPKTPSVGFALGIRTELDENNKGVSYKVQSENRGIPDEVVITIVRNWLRAMEDNYYERFKPPHNKGNTE